MDKIICKICDKEFPENKNLHLHLRKHKIRVVEYYQTHYPRYDLRDGNIIKFKNKDQYFSTDFNSKTNLKAWLKSQPRHLSKKYMRNFLISRKEKKGLAYSMGQVELRSLMAAPVQFYDEIFDDCITEFSHGYYALCHKLGFENKFDECDNIITGTEYDKSKYKIYIDTRERKPLKFDRDIEIQTLKFGDYTFSDQDVTCGCYIERKSLADFVGTLSGGYDRFSREMLRAHRAGAYMVVLIESKMSNATSFQFLRKAGSKDRVFKNVRATPEFIMHNMRKIISDYPNCQFLFVDGRKEASRVIEKIFTCGCMYRTVDLQLAYDRKIL